MPLPLLYWATLPKYASTDHEIKRSSSLPRTLSLHYDAPAERVDQNAEAHILTSRDTLRLTLRRPLRLCWMSGACDSISFETISTWSNIFRICSYTICGEQQLAAASHISATQLPFCKTSFLFWFNFLQKHTKYSKNWKSKNFPNFQVFSCK